MTQLRSIAVAQTCPVAGSIEANLDQHIRLAELAGEYNAGVVVFPELSLMGYELPLAGELAMEVDDPRVDCLSEMAERFEMVIIAGAPVRQEDSLYLSALILSPDRTRSLYTKHRLGTFPPSAACDSLDGSVPPSESSAFEAGRRNPLVSYSGHTAALAICADIGNPAHAENAARRGADSYLASMFVIPSELDGEQERLGRYARQHGMMTAMANYGSPSGGLHSAGRSSIWSDKGELLVQLSHAGTGIAIATETIQGNHEVKAVMMD